MVVQLFIFGHDPDLVSVLDGGYKKCVREKKVTNEIKILKNLNT